MIDEEVERITRSLDISNNAQELFVTESEIRQLIKYLPMGKASGYHRLDTEHIKFEGPLMVEVLTDLFNMGLNLAGFSKVFKFGLLIPNPKHLGKGTILRTLIARS